MNALVRRAGFIWLVSASLSLPWGRALSAQGRQTVRLPSDSVLKLQAMADPAGRELVDMTEQLSALSVDSIVNASTLSAFLHSNSLLVSARNTLAEAQALLKRTSSVADREEQDGNPLLAAFRRARIATDRFSACRRIYYTLDPESFDVTPESCNERYGLGGRFEKRWNARRAGLGVLKAQVASTSVKVLALERSLEAAQDNLDDDLRGKTSYTTVVIVAAALTVLILIALIFGKEDVRRMVFTNVHATELVTVVLVVMAVLYFGSTQALSGEAVSGLLGAIAGYVLGRQALPRGSGAPDATEPPAVTVP